MASMGDPASRLIEELRSLLDETTILSISSDFDLDDPQQFAAAREILLTISKDVEAEEATGFNASGLGADGIVDINPSQPDDGAEIASVAVSDIKSISGLTSTTENSTPPSLTSKGSSRISTRETPVLSHVGVFDGLSDDEKENQLAQMFVSLKRIDVRLALQKSKGDASLAIDELLNLQWLEQTNQRPKGVDGFYVSDDDSRGKKKKGKKKRRGGIKVSTPRATGPEGAPEGGIDNEVVQSDDIVFVSTRFNLSESEVSSIYRRHKASLGATVVQILDNYIALGLPLADPNLLSDFQQEVSGFFWIPRQYITSVIDICPTRRDAVDVVRVLAEHFERSSYLKIDVPYRVVASDSDVVSPTIITTLEPASTTNPQSPTSLRAAASVSQRLAASRSHSMASATAAFKKGRSDPLFRQAGALFAERARAQTDDLRRAAATLANLRVDEQSAPGMIDLHGMTVQDGVTIALERVGNWWRDLAAENAGDERARRAAARAAPFKVVTGIGRHNPDGRSPLRIGVSKALVNNGWKIEVLTGAFCVTGRQ
ncbi:hypothetical protein GGS23DRAFT_374500 [Durotheca rogersii]|uniref:uncharacterized protein n=1 Tax=Durotheca rogersii TaxID=419775 RepID=UPI00221FC012|nr:uncharacterized protein GGS23DRAFT_374500 [Durotheca rogersii]KAI5866210.1 hypothetical protein GGS23DRAFT_374500 [Durotheca rogersii]